VLRASVIIETKDAARSLGATLERVFDQDVAPFEVIVVDGGSRARAVADAGNSDALFLSIAPGKWNNARALNRAAKAARGDILVLLSARCRPVGTDWLENLIRHFDDPTVAGVWGGSLFGTNLSMPPFGPPTRQRRGSYSRENWMWGLSNANGAVRAGLLAHEPFDESLPALEDKQWARVMMERGYCIVHDPAAAVRHDREPVRSARRRRRHEAQGLARMFPETGRDRALPVPARP
jgi:rhamnosyltransferase